MVIEVEIIAKAVSIVLDKYRKDKEAGKPLTIQNTITDFSYTEIDSGETTKTEFDTNIPDVIFENPTKRDILVKEITIIPDASFKSEGMIEIYINDEIIFRNKKAGNFAYITQSEVLFGRGKKIKSNSSINIFLKTVKSKVGIAAQVTFGD